MVNLKIWSAIVLALLPLRAEHDAADFPKGKLLYESALSSPQNVQGWRMEGPGEIEFQDGWMHMYSSGEKWHHVFWCPQDFPNRFIAEWEMQNMEPNAGLCIVFFAAKGIHGESIFDPKLPKRDGTFKQYTKGQINNYHISYYANNPKKPNRGNSHLRKNKGFVVVQRGKVGIPTKSTKIHKIRLIKDGAHIIMFVDQRKIIDWTDDGEKYGPVLKDGKIGFRQMRWTHFRYRKLKIWALHDKS